MVLIVGGAYQGKEAYARAYTEKEGRRERVVSHYETIIREQFLAGRDPVEELHALLSANPDICLVADEVGRGVVPLGKEERRVRDVIGRTLVEAAREANEVYRVTCGIGERIK